MSGSDADAVSLLFVRNEWVALGMHTWIQLDFGLLTQKRKFYGETLYKVYIYAIQFSQTSLYIALNSSILLLVGSI